MTLLPLLSGWAWRTSVEALPLALVAILLWRWRSLPAAWRWWLPALFFLRLAMPQVPEVGWHAWSLSPAPSVNLAVAAPVSATAASSAIGILPILWALGCAAVAGWVVISHWRLGQLIRRDGQPASAALERHAVWAAARLGLSRTVPLRVMPGWSTMAVCGWQRPVLLIPADLADRFNVAQLRGMFLHEMAHVRRRDVLWTWLALGLCALHWFNPLAWLALRRFHADRELACDAAALRALEPAARHDYGEALLLCLRSPALHTAPALAPFFRRFPELKQRLQNIMTPATPTLVGRLFAALLIPSLVAITFTTARAQRDGDAPKPAAPETPAAERPLREGEKPKAERREGEAGKEKARDGEGGKPAAREGDKPRDGDKPREGDKRRDGEREGDKKRNPERDGDGARKAGPRDGEQPRKAMRDGEQPKSGPRDGEVKKSGPRDGEGTRAGPRDGDAPKAGPREGDAPRAEPREGERGKPEGDKPEAR